MNDWSAILNSFCWFWSRQLLQASLSGGAVILLVWALCRAWPRIPPSTATWLWRAAFGKVLLALLWNASIGVPVLPAGSTFPWSFSRPVVKGNPDQPATDRPEALVPAGESVPPTADNGREPRGESDSRTLLSAKLQRIAAGGLGTKPLPVLNQELLKSIFCDSMVLVWLSGSLCLMFRGLRAHQLTRHWRKRSTVVHEAELLADLEQLHQHYRLARSTQLLSCTEMTSMALTGVLRPAVFLSPAFSCREAPSSELRLMLAHELAHQKRQDLAWNWLLWIGQTLFWFHPMVWLAAREWRVTQEIACDALAIQATQVPVASYGAMLLKTAVAGRSSSTENIFAVGVGAHYEVLHRRLSAMKHYDSIKTDRRSGLLGLALVVLALLPWRLTLAQTSGLEAKQWKQNAEILSLAYSPDGRLLASSGNDSKVRIWEVSTGRLAKILNGPPQIHSISKIAFSQDGKTLVSVSDKIRLWDVTTGALRSTLSVAKPNSFEKKHYGAGYATAVALSPTSDVVASTGQYLTVHAKSGKAGRDNNREWQQVYQQKFFYGTDLSFTPDGKTLIEAGWNGRLNFWNVDDLRRGRPHLQNVPAPIEGEIWSYGKANSLAVSSDGQWLVVAYGYSGGLVTDSNKATPSKPDGKVILWNLKTAKMERAWRLPQVAALSVAVSSDGRWVANADANHQVHLWSVETGQSYPSLDKAGPITSVSFSQDGNVLTTGSEDGIIKFWPLSSLPQPGSTKTPWKSTSNKLDFDPAETGSYKFTSRSVITFNEPMKGRRRDEIILRGIPNGPATLKTGGLLLRATQIVLNTRKHSLQAAGEKERVQVEGLIVPKGEGPSLRLEATAVKASFNGETGTWKLSGNVKGFYETAQGRVNLAGDLVTISRSLHAVLVLQSSAE